MDQPDHQREASVRRVRWAAGPPPRRGRRYLLALVLISLLLAGCTLPRSTPPIIKIGMIAPFEGLYRPRGYAALYAVKLALRERNAAGGVAGYGVMLVALNDDGDPEEAALQARKLAVDPDVMGVIGPFSRTTAAAAAPLLAEAGLAWIAPVSVPDGVVQAYPNAFRLFASDQALAEALVTWARETPGGDGRIWIAQEGPFSRPLQEAAEQRGISWRPSPGASKPTHTTVALGGDPEQVADALRSLDRAIYQGPIVGGPESAEAVVLQRAGSSAMGLVWATSLQPAVWPDAFVLGYQEMAGGPPGPEAALVYDATNVLLDAIAWDITRRARPTREGVVAAVGATHWDGLSGSIAFDANGSWLYAPVHLYQIIGGQRFGPVP
ncbi:MAG: ABC transporter substrate-binding protein [Chloroflexi bacterium]|nr:ABC transporter substrate-binding protein [Chloroflexota bacterium]